MVKSMERQIITNISQIDKSPQQLAKQVSEMIGEYNSQHPFEMLPKSPEVIIEQLNRGLSIMMIEQDGILDPEILFHGSLYPNFENGEEKALGCQVIECGSWIVNPNHRGRGLGTEGVGKLIDLGRKFWNPTIFLATHKRMAALKVSKNVGLTTVDYKDFPYLAYLTCTCTNCSESYGFEICVFRRKTPEISIVGEGGKIDCSLVISDIVRAEQFEERCRNLHFQIEEPLKPGEITIDTMNRARRFFEWIKNV